MNERQVGLLLINGPLPPPYGGVATYLSSALPYLVQRGFKVYTVLEKRPADREKYHQFEEMGVSINFDRVSRLRKLISFIRHGGLWLSVYRSSRLPFIAFLQTVDSIVRWLDVCDEILRTNTIDIIHAYDSPWAQGFVAAHLATKYGKKYVQTTFGEIVPHREELIPHDTFGDQYRDLVRNVLNKANRIISLSRHCASEVEYIGVPRDNVRITHWGVDTNQFHPALDGAALRQHWGIGKDPMILFVGQVRLRKGPQVLIEAIPAILRQHPNARFFIVGPDYGIVAALKRRAHELGVEKNVIFPGSKSHVELPAYYAACNIFVFPTCTPIECLGLSMIQAMASGKPVVGSRIDGIPEVIVDGETGFLVEPGDPSSLAEKVNRLLSDTRLQIQMGEAGRRRAEREFDQEKLVTQLEQVYYDVLDD